MTYHLSKEKTIEELKTHLAFLTDILQSARKRGITDPDNRGWKDMDSGNYDYRKLHPFSREETWSIISSLERSIYLTEVRLDPSHPSNHVLFLQKEESSTLVFPCLYSWDYYDNQYECFNMDIEYIKDHKKILEDIENDQRWDEVLNPWKERGWVADLPFHQLLRESKNILPYSEEQDEIIEAAAALTGRNLKQVFEIKDKYKDIYILDSKKEEFSAPN